MIFNNAIEEALFEAMGDEFDAADHEWINTTMRKSEISDYVSRLVDVYGASQVAPVLDAVKDLGFLYATQAGVSISKNDIVTPDAKGGILERIEKEVADVGDQYQYGLITDSERHEKVVILWGQATDEVEVAMRDSMWRLNPIYMMAHSGARGSFKQIRQLAGMRGLMANPKGEIIERPIKANFMEGLSVLEYFISTHGARKGLADTALRTADSGYLTRRLVDVSQDVIVREDDCGTDQSIEALLYRSGRPNRALVGRVLAEEIEIGERDDPGQHAARRRDATPACSRSYDEAVRPAPARALRAQVRGRGRRVPELLRLQPRHGRDERDRGRGRHRRGPVDRRAGHPAHHADVP